jgi:anti-anti-sigma factor
MAQRFNWNNLESDTVAQLVAGHSLDGHVFGETYRELIDQVELESPNEVVLDFSSVRSMSSSGLRRLLKLKERVRVKGGEVTLLNVGDHLHQVFVLAGLARYFGLHPGPKSRRAS